MHDLAAGKPLRLLLADGHALFRAGLRYLLRDLGADFEMREAASAEALWQELDGEAYSLVLVDHALPSVGPLSIRDVLERAQGTPVAVFSASDDPALIRAVLHDGAAAFIPKDTSPRLMIQALNLVLAGGVYVPASILTLLPQSPAQDPAPSGRTALTMRQRQVWEHLAMGASNKHIARALGLSEGAVKAHVAGLLRLLGARSRAEALARATQAGWMDGDTIGKAAS